MFSSRLTDARWTGAHLIRRFHERAPNADVFAYGSPDRVLVALGSTARLLVDAQEASDSYWDRLAGFLEENSGSPACGFLGFDLHRSVAPELSAAPAPAACMFVPSAVLEVVGTTVTPIYGDMASVWPNEPELPPSAPLECSPASQWDRSPPDAYERAAASVLEWIGESARRRATLARRIELPTSVSLIDSMAIGHCAGALSRCFYVSIEDLSFAGCSPELLAEGDRDLLYTHKLSGTYPRDLSRPRDDALRASFLADRKIADEHEQSVSATRRYLDRLGRVSQFAPVVEDLIELRHLRTTFVTALDRAISPADVLRAVFPSGVNPYPEGISVIGSLEPDGRGAYYGLVGFVGRDGRFSFSQILRSIFRSPAGVHAWAGAALTHLSTTSDEYRETRLKLSTIRVTRR